MSDDVRDDELVTVVVGDSPAEAPAEHSEAQAPEVVSWPVDDVCAGAVSVARDALLEEADASLVGEHIGVVAEGPMLVTHYFAGSVPGYQGWRWSVTVSRAPDSDHVGIDETALLPDGNALLAPVWVPWKQRIQSGDLGPGDLMVTESDDPRLVPGMASDDLPEPSDDLLPEQWELGLGRLRVLSPEGRREAAQRWYREVGPKASAARTADLECATCGFLMLIGGPMGQAFGVCANGYAALDGRVVALNFGCGAHSETREVPSVAVARTVIDEVAFDDLAKVELPSDDEAAPDDPAKGEAAPGDESSRESDPADESAVESAATASATNDVPADAVQPATPSGSSVSTDEPASAEDNGREVTPGEDEPAESASPTAADPGPESGNGTMPEPKEDT